MKLRKVILLLSSGVSIFLALLASGLLWFLLSIYNLNQAKQSLYLTAQACETWLNSRFENSMTMAQLTADTSAARTLLLDMDDGVSASRLLVTAWARLPAESDAALVDKTGHIMLASDNRLVGRLVALDDRSQMNILSGLSAVTPVVTNLFAGAPTCVASLYPVMNGSEMAGYVMVYTNATVFENIVTEAGGESDCDIALFDTAGSICGISGEFPVPDRLTLYNQSNYRNEKTEGVFDFKLKYHRWTAASRMLAGSGWELICLLDPKKLMLPGWWWWIPALTLFVLSELYRILLRYVLDRNYTHPLAILDESIGQIEGGDYSKSVPYLGTMEIGEVGEAFNQMLRRIRDDRTELAIKEERYRILNEQTNSIIFEYNVETAAMTCSPNGRMLANYPSCMELFPTRLVERQDVCGPDSETLQRLFESMKHGRLNGDMDLQIRTYNGTMRWFHLQLSSILDSVSKKPLRVVGKLTDIDEEKRAAQTMAYKAERDALTGLYNRGTTFSAIVQQLADRNPERIYALMMVDIDNFKRVNDGYGHQKGDAIIAAVAGVLQTRLGAEHICGRLGGDEFMLLYDAPDIQAVTVMAQSIVQEVRTIILDEATGEPMGVSMGISLCPQDGVTYQQLYAHADNALYAVKRDGKNGFAYYRA